MGGRILSFRLVHGKTKSLEIIPMAHLQGLFFWRTQILWAAPKTFSVIPAFCVYFPGYFCTGYETLTFIFFLSSSKGEMANEVFSFLQNGYVGTHICLFPPLHWTLLLVRRIGETLTALDFVCNTSSFRNLLLWSIRADWRGEGKRVSSHRFDSGKWWSSNSGLFMIILYYAFFTCCL